MKKVLLATDGSEEVALAVRAAIDLSERTGAELHVIHAWSRPPLGDFLGLSSDYQLAYEREAEGLLERQVESLRASGGTVARAHLRRGRPAEAIVDLAEELDADLIVMGSRRLGAVKRLVIGSVTEGVVHLAARPTLIVSGGERIWPPSRVVIGDDGSEGARRAGELAVGIGRLFDARALLVRVYPYLTVFKARKIVHVQASKELVKRGEESLERRATKLESLLGLRPEVEIRFGDAAAAIEDVAEDGGEPALVAVGSCGPETERRVALSSVSTAVLRSVDASVLVVPCLLGGEEHLS